MCRAEAVPRTRRSSEGVAQKQHHWGGESSRGTMKAYFLMALAGLLACAIAGMIFLEMTQQISPD
jgi:hypothetical protein